MNAPSSPLAVLPPIAILGVPFDNVTTADTLRLIGEMIASRQSHYIATANVDFVVQAQQDPELRRILFDADLVVADGMPLVWASRWLGNPLPERVTGSGMTPLLLALAEEKGWRVFFLGGTEQSVAQAAANTRAKHPKLHLDAYSPPFGRLVDAKHDDPMNNAEILRRLREARPDILLVAFGCPKQERWIYANYRHIGVPVAVSIGVGATIDFLAGTMRRAPVWMQKTGLEWIFRLVQEPRRLFRRYAVGMWVFGWAILGQLRQLRAGRATRARAAATITPVKHSVSWRVKLPVRLDAAAVTTNDAVWSQLLTPPAHVLLDCSGVGFVDSTGVALLVRLQKRVREQQRQMVLAAPSQAMVGALDLMRLREFFTQATDLQSGLQILGNPQGVANVLDMEHASATPAVFWQGEITAVNVEEVREKTHERLKEASGTFVIDLAGLRFICTTGIGLMVWLKKQATLKGIELRFINASTTVLTIVGHLRMGEYLFGNTL
jgi:N-acetylglucosaminyldiphosphoundecaprenol N-acetyl-beta-D-mannosaminyltransferase